MANSPLKRGGAPAPAPQNPSSAPKNDQKQNAAQQPATGAENGVRASDAADAGAPENEGVGLTGQGAEADGHETPQAGASSEAASQASSTVLSGRDRAAWVGDVALGALSSPERTPYYFGEAAKAAYHQGGGKELKSKDMKEALEVGSMVAFVRMAEVGFIPKDRTIEKDLEGLTKNIEKREKSIKEGVEKAKPEHKASAEKNAKYQTDALEVFKQAGELAAKQGDQTGVRALNAILVGQGNASYIGYRMRQDAGDQTANYPLFKNAEVTQGTRGIKDPEVLLKRVKGWMSYEVTADREQKTYDKKPVSDGLADARARAAAATKVSHLFVVPRDFKLDQEFLVALGRKSGGAQNYKPQNQPRELNTNQKAAVEELKNILNERAGDIPAEITPEVSGMMAYGVVITDRQGAEVHFRVEEAENQKQLLAHMHALIGGDEAKVTEAQNYFGKMPRSRELAAAVAENL